ncbi:TylF/MycF/NovP-related O-methyltransferase [Seohaeicola saemankumensis]|uniref:TylF/MycF/NovP-related O-methyltransferase n=1 Tax=Seohaeicola saemankumensis TaxID=481181 RepID=UPI0035CE87D9
MDKISHMTDPRTLYLDLISKVIVNTIYGDPNDNEWLDRVYDPELRQEGRDWPQVAHSMAGIRRIENTRELCERAILEGIPGDFIETGVWRGGTCILMRAVLEAHGDPGRHVWCCNSFEGLPPPDPELYPVDAGDVYHTYKELAISLEQVQANFACYGLLDERTRFVKGFFRDTLHKLDAECFSLIRLDGDMYELTIQALEALHPKLSSGGFVIIDDYGAVPSCARAVDDFRAREGITAPMEVIDWTGVWWRNA